MQMGQPRGTASVEQAGLVLLIGLLLVAAISAIAASGPEDAGPALGSALARKLRCAPRLPGPCWRDPLTEAYGRPLGGLVRALAPAPAPRAAPGGVGLVGVDFRYCRTAACATWTGDPRLTASNRRTTAFTEVRDRRRSAGEVEVTYWIYRPSLGWQGIRRTASAADVAAHAATPLLEEQNPKLVPLETLAGRDHYRFPAAEEPPWRWRV